MYRRSTTYCSDVHNKSGLFSWEMTAVSGYFGACRRILVIGAGGGREVLALTSMGYQAHGFECNTTLAAYAQQFLRSNNVETSVQTLARDKVPTVEEPFDAIIIGWSAYMLIVGRRRRVEFLRRLHPLVTTGSPLLLSFFSRPEDTPYLEAVSRHANAIRRVLRRPLVEIGDDLAPNYVHRFTETEVEAELHEGGFNMICFRPQGPGRTDSGYAVGVRTSHEISEV
jgi:hypothetical protein